jgi:hypothetical protein
VSGLRFRLRDPEASTSTWRRRQGFVTDTPAGAVLSVEHIKFRNGRLASTLLVFERLHWPEVLAELTGREARQSASA